MTANPTLVAPRFARMSPMTWSRIAGAVFLLYIATGLASLAVDGAAGEVLATLTVAHAMVLAVALFALTHRVHLEVAVAALVLRFSEGLWDDLASTLVFAAGSTLFAWLFLRGRLVPAPLAWAGLAASVLLFALLPILGTAWDATLTWILWSPMLVFELAFAGWLLVKGVRP